MIAAKTSPPNPLSCEERGSRKQVEEVRLLPEPVLLPPLLAGEGGRGGEVFAPPIAVVAVATDRMSFVIACGSDS